MVKPVKSSTFLWASEKATAIFHEWAALPDYELLDEDLAINLVCRIRDALIDARTMSEKAHE